MAGRQRTILGHPAGLAVLTLLKVWEVFSYQGMRAFLIFYLIGAFALSDASASVLFGSYAALTLATAVLGGLLADRWLGEREPAVAGAVLIMAGHLVLALQHMAVGLRMLDPPQVFQLFCLALALIAVGTGLLKPNVLNLIGGLYRSDDPKRDVGYYLYYMGVNLGSLAAPLVCGWAAQRFGWSWGFAAAALGMAVGLTALLLGRGLVRRFDGATAAPQARPRRLAIYAGVAACVAAASLLIQHGLVLAILLGATLAAGCAYLLAIAARDPTGADRRAVLRLFLLLPVPAVFVVMFEQFSLVINLFADRLVDRQVLGVQLAASQLLSLNGLFVILLLPVLSLVWARLRARRAEPPIQGKFALGFLIMASGFALLAAAIGFRPPGATISMVWVAVTYLLITLGEIMIAPLAYAAVGRIVPRRLEGVGTGLLLLSFAAGNLCAGGLATLAAAPPNASRAALSGLYGRYFVVVAAIGVVASLCALGLKAVMGPASYSASSGNENAEVTADTMVK